MDHWPDRQTDRQTGAQKELGEELEKLENCCLAWTLSFRSGGSHAAQREPLNGNASQPERERERSGRHDFGIWPACWRRLALRGEKVARPDWPLECPFERERDKRPVSEVSESGRPETVSGAHSHKLAIQRCLECVSLSLFVLGPHTSATSSPNGPNSLTAQLTSSS